MVECVNHGSYPQLATWRHLSSLHCAVLHVPGHTQRHSLVPWESSVWAHQNMEVTVTVMSPGGAVGG